MRTSEVTIFRQRGVVVVLTAVSMVALIAMAGLALDMGHAFLNKTRLQNSLDAAALAAAKTLNDTGDTTVAAADGLAVFNLNAAGAGNGELLAANLVPTFAFSNTLYPFVSCAPACTDPQYVRAAVDTYALDAFLIQVIGINQKTVGASAVAGPSPTLIAEACDVAPMMVCGDPAENGDTSDGDFFGYAFNELQVMKTTAPGGNFEVGPGNFQLIRFGSPGGAAVREAMAGDFGGCASTGDNVSTEPGGTMGPVVQGFNTRFGDWGGPLNGAASQYPSDVNNNVVNPPLDYIEIGAEWKIVEAGTTTVVTADTLPDMSTEPWNYDWYQTHMKPYTHPPPIPPNGFDAIHGAFDRRLLTVPVGDCTATVSGSGDVPLLGFGCFFLLQRAVQKGNNAELYGEFVDGCAAYGPPGPNPNSGAGPYIIQLYEDTSSLDS